MKVLIWVREGVWQAAVDSAVALAGPDAEYTLLHVIQSDVAQVMNAGLFGRHRHSAAGLQQVASTADHELLAAAQQRLGANVQLETRSGRVEREVVVAAESTDLLVLSRDGDRRRLGPHSLGPATRFVVDHAPCPVLLVWPESAPDLTSIPPAPTGPPPAEPPPRPNTPRPNTP